MHIVFFTRLFYPHIGGVEKHVLEISKVLLKNGHAITIVTEELPDMRERQSINEATKQVLNEIKIYRIPVGSEDWMKKFRIWFWLFQHRNIMSNADLIHCHDVFFWYLPFRFLYPTKLVYMTFHGYEGVFPVSKKAIIIRKLSEKLSHGNICVGDFIKKWYKTKPTFVTYGAVVQTKSEKRKAQNYNVPIESGSRMATIIGTKLKILFVGRLDDDTGIHVYLTCLQLLKQKKIPFVFQAIGDGKYRKDVEKYGTVHGFVESVESFVQDADIVFASSYLSILESLLQKKIIIAVYDNSLKEDYLRMSPFSRYIFICKNSEEVFTVIKTIQHEPWKIKSMIEKGQAFAKEQTWESVTNTYLQLWKQASGS